MIEKAILKTASEKDPDKNIYEVVTFIGISEINSGALKFRIEREDGSQEKVHPSRVKTFHKYVEEIRGLKNSLLDLSYAGVDVEESFKALCELEEDLK